MCKNYVKCIDKNYLLNELVLKDAEQIVAELRVFSTLGRPSISLSHALNGIYYLLKTGLQWAALPYCFGSKSSIHRVFQKLRRAGFFEKLWHKELQRYDQIQGLALDVQTSDCTHIKAPLGQQKTGNSPVDRRKLGTKRSIITDKNGVVIGCSLDGGNRHDSILFDASIRSIPKWLRQPRYKEMHLDSAYDSKKIKTILFNFYYVPRITKNRRHSKIDFIQKKERKRWVVESSHSWMNRFRRLLIRFEKLANNYLALMQFALSIITFNKSRVSG